MRHLVNPQQTRLVDSFEGIIPPLGLAQIRNGWQGVFRHTLLQLMPAPEHGQNYHPTLGRPTKELYSVTGLILLQEMMNWTNAEAVQSYLFRTDVQYALNLEPGIDEMCERTLERHRARYVENERAASVMDRVTTRLIGDLELEIDRQRLDSTHVFSDMASFGRTRLMGIAVKRFLTQAQRHYPEDYRALPEILHRRYAPSTAKLFAGEGASPEARSRTRQRVAEDLHDCIVRFAAHPGLKDRPSYKAMVTVFDQQCELVEAKVMVRAKTGGACMQNPSDPDATYDGHKGQGYKLQVLETCSEANEAQLILAVLPQTAATPDAEALIPILQGLEEKGRLPDSMTADTAYGGDDNVQAAAKMGVELVSPVAGRPTESTPADAALPASTDDAMAPEVTPEMLTVDDFAVDERTGKVTACPAGRIPLSVIYDVETSTTTVEMPASACDSCPDRKECPIIKGKSNGRYKVGYTDKQRRLAERRREEDTDAFRQRYAKRAGIESTNSGLKRRLGLGHLRVRGKKAVFHALYLKSAGWNILRAVATGKLISKVVEAMARVGLAHWLLLVWSLTMANRGRIRAGSWNRARMDRSRSTNTKMIWVRNV